MTDTKVNPAQRQHVALFATGSLANETSVKKYFATNAKGAKVLVLNDVPVFRSGTFRDSMGFQHTWDPLHMSLMVTHFDHLLGKQIFTDVPVRKGHGSFFGDSMDGLIGYHTALRTKDMVNPTTGKTETYLLADFEILDPTAQANINSGLWKNRSAEIGMYVTNDEAEYSPTYMGVAYVDIPAVEGLNGFSKFSQFKSDTASIVFEEDPNMSGTTTASQTPATPPPVPAPVPVQHSSAAVTDTNTPNLVELNRLAEVGRQAEASASDGSDHSRGVQPVQKFKVNGQEVTDLAAIQTHIDGLEEYSRVTQEQQRTDFVNGLAASNIIRATQLEGMLAYAKGLDGAGYSAFSALYGTATPDPLLAGHQAAQQFSQSPAETNAIADSQAQGAPDEKMLVLDKINMFRTMNLPKSQIEATPSFARMKQLDPTFIL